MSSSESSLLEKRTQEKHLFYSEFVTPPRAQKSIALIHGEIAIRYVLVPSCTSDLIVQPLQVQLNPTIEVGQAYRLSIMADPRIWFVQRGEHDIEHELIFSRHDGYVFHDSRGMEAGSEDELKIVQDFVQSRSQKKRLKAKLHAIWFVPVGMINYKFTKVFPFRYCVPMDSARPSLELKQFENICPDKNGI